MKRSLLYSLLFLAASAMLAPSCDTPLSPEGKQVKFSVSAKYQALTKTEYAGNYAETGSTHEDIYWSDGDGIRIFSSNPAVVATPSGGASADYTLMVSSNRTRAALNNSTPNGLAWQAGDETPVIFYGVYPPTTMGEAGDNFGKFYLQIPQSQDYKEPKKTVMSYASMLSKKSLTNLGEDVNMDFYPAFSAFQINLKSADGALTLKRFRIYSETDALSGNYMAAWIGDGDGTVANMQFYKNPSMSTEKDVYVDFPDGTTIDTTTAVDFTLLTIPAGLGGTEEKLTNLWIEVTFEKESNPGTEIVRRLALKQNGNFIAFDKCKKYRINGLAVDGGEIWQLTIRTDVNEWNLVEKTTTFKEQIGIKDVSITGQIENENHYDSLPGGYAKYYNIRTLNMSVANPHFVVIFNPFAPLGGYWTLIPEAVGDGSLEHFDVKLYLGEGEYSDELVGQIMGNDVEVHIFPKDFNPEAGVSYAIILKSYVSAQRTFDEPYSADSEFQDVHSDGRYSYWRFTLPSSN